MNRAEASRRKLLRSLTVLGVTAFALVATSLVGVAPASAERKAITGTVTIPAGGTYEILPPDHGRVFWGDITARGGASGYGLAVMIQGAIVNITGLGSQVRALRNQSATFNGESLQIRNFTSGDKAMEITVRFAVSYERSARKHDKHDKGDEKD